MEYEGSQAGVPEKLFSSAMRAGSDPTDFIAKMDDLRLRLADMGRKFSMTRTLICS